MRQGSRNSYRHIPKGKQQLKITAFLESWFLFSRNLLLLLLPAGLFRADAHPRRYLPAKAGAHAAPQGDAGRQQHIGIVGDVESDHGVAVQAHLFHELYFVEVDFEAFRQAVAHSGAEAEDMGSV